MLWWNQNMALPIEGSVCLLKELGKVLVTIADSPNEDKVIFFDSSENISSNIRQPFRLK